MSMTARDASVSLLPADRRLCVLRSIRTPISV